MLLAAQVSLFLRLCGLQLTPDCGVYLNGFYAAMRVNGAACLPADQRIEVEKIRAEAVDTARRLRDDPERAKEGAAIHSAIAKMYPCKEK